MDGLTIDEAAHRMGISKDTLRYYEKEGLLPPIRRPPTAIVAIRRTTWAG